MNKWTILQSWCTTSTTHQPTIMHYRHLHQEQVRNCILMLSTNQEHPQCHHPNIINLTPVDINLNHWDGLWSHHPNLPDQAPKSISIRKPIHVLHLSPACSATSQHFHPPPHYEIHQMMINTLLNTANLNAVNISSPEFQVWQHLEDHWNKSQLHKLADIWLTYLHSWCSPIQTNDQQQQTYSSISTSRWVNRWYSIHLHTIFSHRFYITAIGLLIPAGQGIFCCYFFWCWPAILAHQPFQSGSTWHTTVYDDVEAAPIYRSDGKAGQPVLRPLENHDLHMKWEPTPMKSLQKQQAPSKAVPKSGSLNRNTQNPGNAMSTHGLL